MNIQQTPHFQTVRKSSLLRWDRRGEHRHAQSYYLLPDCCRRLRVWLSVLGWHITCRCAKLRLFSRTDSDMKRTRIISLFLLLQLKSWCVGWWRLTRCYELQHKMLCFMSGKLHVGTLWVTCSRAHLQRSLLHDVILWNRQDRWKRSLRKKPEGWSVCTVWEELCESQVEGKIIL